MSWTSTSSGTYKGLERCRRMIFTVFPFGRSSPFIKIVRELVANAAVSPNWQNKSLTKPGVRARAWDDNFAASDFREDVTLVRMLALRTSAAMVGTASNGCWRTACF